MLDVKIKASAVANLTDARYFAAAGVTWLGFNFDEGSEGALSPLAAKAIREWVDSVLVVGEFGLQSTETILGMAKDLDLDAVQVGPFAEVDAVQILATHLPVFQEIVVSKDSTAEEIEAHFARTAGHVQHFLLSFDRGGVSWTDLCDGRPFPHTVVADWCDRYPVLLGMEARAEAWPGILDMLQPDGLVCQGGEEEKVGYKSFDELDDLFEVLEAL